MFNGNVIEHRVIPAKLKTINNLTTTSYTDGENLSAYQGKVLNDMINKRASIMHSTSGTEYGVGTTTKYGHCKVANNLDNSSFTDSGVVLSAYQGYVLNNKINSANNSINNNTNKINNLTNDTNGLKNQIININSQINSVNSNKSNVLSRSNVAADNKSISTNSTNSFTISMERSGYTCIGIVGINLANASSSGVNASFCNVFDSYLSGSNAIVGIRNLNTGASAKIKIVIQGLYIKN